MKRFLSSRVGDVRQLNVSIQNCKSGLEIDALVMESSGAFNQVNLATAFKTLSRFGFKSSPVLQRLVEVAKTKEFNSRQLSNICHSLARHQKRLPEFLSQQIVLKVAEFNAQDLSNTLWAFARTPNTAAAGMAAVNVLIKEIPFKVGEFKPQELANTMWSLTKLNLGANQAIVGELEKRDLKDFPPQSLANLTWALTSDGGSNQTLLCKINRELVDGRDLASFLPQDVSNICYSFAKSEFSTCTELFTKLAEEVFLHPAFTGKEYPPQAISNTLWAFATAKFTTQPKASAVLGQLLLKQIDLANPIALSNSMWALAKLGLDKDTALCQAVYDKTTVAKCSPQSLANILWAFAKQGFTPKDKFARLLVELQQAKLDHFSPQALSLCMWSLASLGATPCAELFDTFLREMSRRKFDSFAPQNYSHMVWALCAFNMRGDKDGTFLLEVCDAMTVANGNVIQNCREVDLASLAMSLSSLAVQHDRIIDQIAHECARRITKFTSEELINLMWAFACWDALKRDAVLGFFQLEAFPTLTERSNILASQLFQIQLACKQAGLGTPKLVECMRWEEWGLELVANERPVPSRTQLALAKLLEKRETVELEAIVAGGLSVDMFLPERHLAVEVDGPSHFFQDGKTATGKTRFKRRLLERAGYKVLSLSVKWFENHDRASWPRRLDALLP
ncbi:hypothetical protein BASA81_004510 [Batrachochytrium salamandrivorans]|nr:hypothetical protein BASA81_004510 [Batrachochytrium salamandrivorans]